MPALRTINLTAHRVWVTIYDLAKTRHLDYGYMEASTGPGNPGARLWTSGYAWPGIYHARGAVKDTNDSTIFDTEIELGTSASDEYYAAYLTGDGSGNYWWVQVSNSGGADLEDAVPNGIPQVPPVS